MITRALIVLIVLLIMLQVFVAINARGAYSKPIVIVDDDGTDCPNADLVGENAIQKAIDTRLVEYNGTIIACSGVYSGFTNIIEDFYGGREVRPVKVVGKGNVTIIYNIGGSLVDVVLTNLSIVLHPTPIEYIITLRLGGKITIINSSIRAYGDDWSFGELFIGNNANVKILSSILKNYNPSLENAIVYSANASYIEVKDSNISGYVELRARTILFSNNIRDSRGSYDKFSMKCFFTGFYFICIITKPHPTTTIIGDSVNISNNTFTGSLYVESSNLVMKGNTFIKKDSSNVYNYNPVDPLSDVFNAGLDFILVRGNGIIENNVFKYAGEIKTYSKYNITLWGALRLLGVFTVHRNLFYENNVGLIINSSSLVYDNLFIENEVQAVSKPVIELNVDPPVKSTNIIGGPYIGGNYWSDYRGYDIDGDGLGDIPYRNSYGAVDIHPLTMSNGEIECPPYMGATSIVELPDSRLFLLLLAPLIASMLYPQDKKRKGTSNILSVTMGVLLAIVLVLITVLVVYNPSVAALSKVSAPLVPIGHPQIINGQLEITLYNPGSVKVCVEDILVNGERTQLIPSLEFNKTLLSLLEDAVKRDNTTLIRIVFEKTLIENRIVYPKNSRKFIGIAPPYNGVAELSVIANNGVWRMYANDSS